jgi:hypothetical protein
MLPRWTLRPVMPLLALPALVAALGTTAVAETHTPLEKRPGADTRTTE